MAGSRTYVGAVYYDSQQPVTVQGSGMLLWEAKFVEEGAETEDLSRAMRTGEVLSTGRECNNGLLFWTPGKWTISALDNVT